MYDFDEAQSTYEASSHTYLVCFHKQEEEGTFSVGVSLPAELLGEFREEAIAVASGVLLAHGGFRRVATRRFMGEAVAMIPYEVRV